jgi:hypothetical protein
MKKLLGLLLALSVCATDAAGQDAQWRPVQGRALQGMFADQALGDGVHYSYQFHRDGQLIGIDMGKTTRGIWKVTGATLCYAWNRRRSEEECYEVRRRGNEVRMFRDGYEAFSGTLTPMPPQPIGEEKP